MNKVENKIVLNQATENLKCITCDSNKLIFLYEKQFFFFLRENKL